MKKKANLFLVLSVLVALYLVFGLLTMIGNFSNYSSSDLIGAIIVYALFVWIGITFFKKYKKYSDSEYLEEEKKEVKSKPRSKLKTLVISIIILISLGVVYLSENDGKMTPKSNKVFSKTIGINLDQTEKALDILKQCEIYPIESIKHDEMLDDKGIKGYRLESRDVNNIILYMAESGLVSGIRWADNDFYKDGKVVSKITDYRLTLDEMTSIQIDCQDSIKSLLKVPSTAKFPGLNDWKLSKNKEEVIVQSYVDAENSFGAKIRSEFQFKIKDNQTTSLIFDGEEHIK